ncbi:hypothetical protein CANARDRAFT_7297 [[Candida] arabinofermentans NRRL YB-2248]|uniref:Eukaryotic translation initiation factor 3 subunit C n=1 Tax=[Candida] arabinofermentans NRRL YB-2248 TaxID=983967 RepID=A0A1E4T2G6_9ASCO|nr:hypothetical protein CANARDRAFT_7297 [[Candida] arabinofermentans NRRL YB-2248]
MSRFFATAYESDVSSDEELLSSDDELISSSGSETESKGSDSEDADQDDDEDNDSEDWDSDFEGDDDDDDSDDDYTSGKAKGPSYFLKKDFLKGGPAGSDSDSDSDSDDEKKVVKSAKEKYLDEIASSVDQIENFSMVEDWIKIANEFDRLSKAIARYPQYHIPVPRLYIKSLAILEDAITGFQEKDTKKKLNASESKSFNIVRQRVRKSSKEFQSDIDLYRKDPEAYETGSAEADAEAQQAKEAEAAKSQSPDAGVFTVLRSVIETRGKRNVDQSEQIQTLEDLISRTSNAYQLISIYLMLIPVRFDQFAKAPFMPAAQWKASLADINSLLDVLQKNPTYVVSELAAPIDDIEVEPEANSEGVKEIIGSLVSLAERLDDALTAHLLAIDPHSSEYVSRLRDETALYTLLVKTQVYYERITAAEDLTTARGDQLSRVILKRLDHIYFKPSKLIIFAETSAWNTLNSSSSLDSKVHSKISSSGPQGIDYTNGLLDALCLNLYKQQNSIFRKKAVLYHIYYYAFNDQFYKSRDMLLLSHLQASIHTADPQLQVLFNRALVQVGLSAFRSGLIGEAQQLLHEIAISARQKELLGQGNQRFQNQQTQADKQRLLPFHMHINLELLECSFYAASLLIEIPQIAQNPEFARKRQTSSKAFRRVLEYHDRQIFAGPPETTRDYIVLAAKALAKSDWKKASELINSVKIWDLYNNADQLKKMLLEKLQIEALRTYLFTNQNFYSKLSISDLSTTFEITESAVKSTVAKMIMNEELNVVINQLTNMIEFSETENKGTPTKLQELSLGLSEKVAQLIERNERLSTGGYQVQYDKKQAGNTRSGSAVTVGGGQKK